MAMRRPRIKPVANIQVNGKRKQKTFADVKDLKENTCPSKDEVYDNKNTSAHLNEVDKMQLNSITFEECKEHENKVIPNLEYNIKNENATLSNNSSQSQEEATLKINSSILEEVIQDSCDEIISDEINEITIKNDCNGQVDETAFKYPPKVDNNRSMVNGADDVFYSDIEDNNPLQMDIPKFNNCYPMSPTKIQSRQRIRVTPIFGQRRNSFIITPQHAQQEDNTNNNNNNSSNNTNVTEYNNLVNQRRERQLSGGTGSVGNLQTRQLNATTMAGRIRTESSSSAMSESTLLSHGHKSRKSDDSHHHRQNGKRDFENRFPNGTWDKSMLKMFDLIYYNPISNPIEEKSPNNSTIKHEINNATTTNAQMDIKVNVTQEDTKIGVTEEKSAMLAIKESSSQAGMPVPQLKLNANGELILDDKSLVIETTAEQEARKTLANTEPIFLDEYTGMNGFYKRQKRTREWFADETIKFYRCLQTIGTDFSLMATLFPNRTRRDLKLKFKKEERINGTLINKALLYPKQFNIDELKRQIDAEEEEQKNQKYEQLLCKYKVSKKAKKKHFVSAAQRLLEQGDENIYEDENVKKMCRRPRTNKQKKLHVTEDNKESTPTLNLHKYMDVEDRQVKSNKASLKTIGKGIKRELSGKTKENFQIKNENQDNDVDDDVHNANEVTKTCSSEFTTVKNKPLKKTAGTRKTHSQQPSNINALPLLTKEVNNVIEMELNHLLQEGLNDMEDNAINENDAKITCASPKDMMNQLPSFYEDNKVPTKLTSQQNMEEENFQNVSVTEYELISDSNTINAQRLITNLDDGTIMSIDEANDVIDSLHENDISMPHKIVDMEDEEEAIQKIIDDLSEGSLILVSTFDPDVENNVIHEIYKVNKYTNELEDEPLNLPDYIIQGISGLLNKS